MKTLWEPQNRIGQGRNLREVICIKMTIRVKRRQNRGKSSGSQREEFHIIHPKCRI